MPAAVDLFELEPAAQRIVVRQQPVDLVRQRIEIGEIHQPDRAAADLVFIGWADAATGRPDRGHGIGRFPQRVEFPVQWQDQRNVFGDAQIVRADRNALAPELVDLVEKGLRIEHDAIADHRELGGPQHARRQQRQLVGFTVDDEGVARIVAALETDHDIGLLRQPVDDLAFSFVAPLGADDDDIGHSQVFPLQLIASQQHDTFRKTGPALGQCPVACLSADHAPSPNHGRGRSHARLPPDKGSG